MGRQKNQSDASGGGDSGKVGGGKTLTFAIIGVVVTASMISFGLYTTSGSNDSHEGDSIPAALSVPSGGFRPYQGGGETPPLPGAGSANSDSGAVAAPAAPAPAPLPPPPPSIPPIEPPPGGGWGADASPQNGGDVVQGDAPQGNEEKEPTNAWFGEQPPADEQQKSEEERQRLIDEEREEHIRSFFGEDDPRKKVPQELLQAYDRLSKGQPRDLDMVRMLRENYDEAKRVGLKGLQDSELLPAEYHKDEKDGDRDRDSESEDRNRDRDRAEDERTPPPENGGEVGNVDEDSDRHGDDDGGAEPVGD